MKVRSIANLARPEVKSLIPCTHGGELWKIAKEGELRVREVLDFSSNVNPLGASQKAIEAIRSSLREVPFYPDSESTALREAVSRHLGEVGTDNVIVGNGSTELIYLFCDTFLGKGDSVLIPAPTFGEYEKATRKAGGVPCYISLCPNFRINPSDFIDAIDAKTKAIFLCNPNNPTSILASRNDLQKIIEEAYRKNVLVFLDEDFVEFLEDERQYSLVSEVKDYSNLFILRSFTKLYGLTGLRVGYGIACKEVIDLMFRAKVPWNVNCLAQAAAIAVLEDEEYLKKTRALIEEERIFLLAGLEKIRGLRIFPSDANFILIDVRKSGLTAPFLKEGMLKYGVLIRDCSSFTGLDEYYIRLSIRTRRENEKMLVCLKKVIEGS